MQFEPKFQVDYSKFFRSFEFAYHWTPWYNLDFISKNGLQPKSLNHLFNFPERIYVLTGAASKNEREELGRLLCLANKDPRNNGRYFLLKLDTEKVPTDCRFFFDCNQRNTMWTNDIIPAAAIIEKTLFSFEKKNKFVIFALNLKTTIKF